MGSLSPSEVAIDGPFNHEFLHTRGVRLHAATAGGPDAPLVILLHDHTGGWFDYIDVIAPLAEHGFRVAALDMRGFGMSDKPPSGYGIRYAVGDISGAIQSLGDNRAHLVGCGAGGAAAWTLAAAYPDRVASLTSVCSAAPADYRHLKRRQPWLFVPTLSGVSPRGILWRYNAVRMLRQLTHPSFHHNERFAQAAQLRDKGGRIAQVDDAMRKNARLRTARLPAKWQASPVMVPTLLVHGDGHPYPQLLRYATRRVHERPVAVSRIPGTKALPHVEKPEEFVSMLAQFLTGIAL